MMSKLVIGIASLASIAEFMLIIAVSVGAAYASTDDNTRDAVSETFLINNVNPETIKSFLRRLTLQPHLGGTPAELANAEWVAETWRSQGLDHVHLVPYDVLLSYPKNDTPNLVRVLDQTGAVVFTSQGWQKPLYATEEFLPNVLPDFNAYSAPGNVTGDVVYVHFGREEDFDYLAKNGIDVSNKIAIVRYGEVFRGNIAATAESRGVAGLILYSDPEQYAQLGQDRVYPSTVFMPGTGVADGTVYLYDGDPLTPFYPSVESAYRIPEGEAKLPHIPVQPISYDDAWQILSRLGGVPAKPDWQGGLNITYNLGPGLVGGMKVSLEVHTSNQRATTYNVIGVLTGSEEPDRSVVLGNHRDGWIFGAVDPSSGTAAMLELSRVLMALKNETGWRPRRSIVLCSWGSEEYGLIGSVEWAEQFNKKLGVQAVAYLNMDMAIEGNATLRTNAAPLLYDYAMDAAKEVPNPNPTEVAAGRPTVYDTWVLRKPDAGHEGRPRIGTIGAGSDYKAFQHNVGVSSLDIRYTHEEAMYTESLYHTLYETFELVDELYDQGFKFHAAMVQLWGVLTLRLTDDQVLKFSVNEYSDFMTKAHQEVVDQYGVLIASQGISMVYFAEAVVAFNLSCAKFTSDLNILNTSSPLAVRHTNDQLMQVERAFIDPYGLPGRPDFNHVVMAPSSSNGYAGTAFAGLTDTLSGIEALPADQQVTRWRMFSQHLAAVTHHVNTAAKVLTNDLW